MTPGWVGAVARQLGAVFAALLLSTFLIFGALYLVPGDPLKFLTGGRAISSAARAAYVAQYHLNDPFFERYTKWLGDILHGDFGRSLISGSPVTVLLAPRIGSTLLLLTMSSVVMILAGLVGGLLAGLGSKAVDGLASTLAALALAVPPFIAAALLIAVFAVALGWFPVLGDGGSLPDRVYHLVLPAVALALSGAAYIARVTRVALRSEARREHVDTATARGLARPLVVRRHVLRNALLPVTTVAGLTVAGLVAGTVVVESAFGLNGLGSLLVQSVLNKDFSVVQAVALLLVVGSILINVVVDLLYTVIDPRVGMRAAQ